MPKFKKIYDYKVLIGHPDWFDLIIKDYFDRGWQLYGNPFPMPNLTTPDQDDMENWVVGQAIVKTE